MKKILILTGALLLPIASYSEDKTTEETVKETIQETKKEVVEALSQSRDMRTQFKYFGMLNYSPFDLILPSKLGFTLGKMSDVDHTWEFEYLRSSISVPFIIEDLGAMTDERFSLIKRNYFGTQTFNLSYGFNYHIFSLHLGNKYLASVAPGIPAVDLIKIESFGVNLGIGNRWILANRWMLGVDWISWSQPLLRTKYKNSYADYVSNQDDKDAVNKGAKLISYLPRIAVLKLQVGYSF